MKIGIIIVDHGSRRTESNAMLEQLAGLFAGRFKSKYEIVEPAHMEISEPSIESAYAKCVERGAERVVVCPFFLGPGKHWTSDIPKLTADAAANFPNTHYHVSQTLGIDDLILDLLDKRASHCVEHDFSCEACKGTLRSGEAGFEPAIEVKSTHVEATPKVCSTCPFKDQAIEVAKP